ncbi:hypothetical protein [Streptomyces sp. NPDC012746]|uniref:hypothetical protein n=1 Tax=Streptomyces sp. NPDC012746 TaxID=3364845 RepID=UPI0036D02F19
MRHPVEEWFDETWARARLVQVLAGGEQTVPLDARPELGRVESAGGLAELRALSTRGDITDDVCRCLGSLTLALRDAEGLLLARASLHGGDALLWDGGRRCGNLELGDPLGLALLLARHGEVRTLAHFSTRFALALGLREGRPQFRQAGHGPHGAGLLESRGVPRVLRPELAGVSGHDCARLPEAGVERLRSLLAGWEPYEHRRAVALLAWLGRLPETMEAEFGEGVLVRTLLRGLDPVAAACDTSLPVDAQVALGLLRWAGAADEADAVDGMMLADLVEPALRRVWPAGGRFG